MKTNRFRITESELKEIISESSKKVLSEGKTVNNKPYFPYEHGNRFVKPGEVIRFDKNWQIPQNALDRFWRTKGFEDNRDAWYTACDSTDERLTTEQYLEIITQLKKDMHKHNQRAIDNYRIDFETGETYPRFNRDGDIRHSKAKFKNLLYNNGIEY
jgi:hypothetical protein